MNVETMTRWLGRMAFGSLAALTLTVGACATEDPGEAPPECGDNEVNGDELCDGNKFADSSCVTAGFEAGNVSCTAECELVTTECYMQDEDLDGLLYPDELAYGTDPLNPDTDTDGVLDGIEVTNGSDPTNMISYPFHMGIWPNRTQAAINDGVMASSFTEGQVAPEWAWTDQHGNPVNLHQFYGYVTVLSVGAVWCPPCNDAASSAQGLYEEHFGNGDVGVILVEQLSNGNQQGVDPTQYEIDTWVEQYALKFPVVSAPGNQIPASSIPTYFILDAKLRVHDYYQGYPGDQVLRNAIASARAASLL